MSKAASASAENKMTKKEHEINTIADLVESLCESLLSRPAYKRGPFFIDDKELAPPSGGPKTAISSRTGPLQIRKKAA